MLLDISRPYGTSVNGGLLFTINIQSLWDCPARDPAMAGVERKVKIIGSPVRDDTCFYRTVVRIIKA